MIARVAGLLCLMGSNAAAGAQETAFLKIEAHIAGRAEPVCVRAIIQTSDGKFIDGEWGNSEWPAVVLHGKAVTPETVITIPAGSTRVTVGKGPEYFPQTIVTNIEASEQITTLSFELKPVLELYAKGWRAGDAHMHYFHGENQISRMPEESFSICAAAGMDFASFAEEHFGAPILSREESFSVWAPYTNSECQLWLGVESPKSAWGHHASIVYDPWKVRDAIPYNWGIHSIHEQGGVSYPVHPERLFPGRSFEGDYSLFPLNNHLKFFPISALTGHLLDGWSGVSDEPATELTLTSYNKLLELGYRIPLLADSDFCMDRINNGAKGAGFWMNYLQLEGNPLTQAAVCSAIRKGHLFCTTGPLVEFQIDDAIPGDTLPPDGAERRLHIHARYLFNPWTLSYSNFNGTAACAIDQIDLLRNGQIVRSWNPGAGSADIDEPLTESTENSWYMVRVRGNEGVWMTAYSSPIYFDRTERPRQPEVYKPIVNGRLYDARTGEALAGTVSCVRYGNTEWTLSTDDQGRFRARVPIDAELTARDASGRELTRNLLNWEPAYQFCHYLPERYTNKAPAVDDFKELTGEMEWEFPMGLQSATSYVLTNLAEDIQFNTAKVMSAPERLNEKTNTEIVALFIDKTSVAPGDIIDYAAVFRAPATNPPAEELVVAWGAWDPEKPRLYSKFGNIILLDNDPSALTNLGSGFWMRRGSVQVPERAANVNEWTGGLQMFAMVRRGEILEEGDLVVPVNQTRRELLVSVTWDGFPAAWSELGAGPCNFYREHTFKVRYPDYRKIQIELSTSAGAFEASPLADTQHCADTDDGMFVDRFYYDGQCEPEYRNIPFRDPVRPQPAPVVYDGLPIEDPLPACPPGIALMEPRPNAEVTNTVRFYYFVDRTGYNGAPKEVTLVIDGEPQLFWTADNPIQLELEPGEHTWQIEAYDQSGSGWSSEERRFTVVESPDQPQSADKPVHLDAASGTGGGFRFTFGSIPGATYFIDRATNICDWSPLVRTNTPGAAAEFFDPQPPAAGAIYRVRPRM